jgi:hypothetical protein
MFEQKTITAGRIAAIQADLAARKDREQRVRHEITELIRAGTPLDALNSESPVIKKMIEIDKENVTELKAILAECGWIDAARFGSRTANAAFLIVQHSGDDELMGGALPHIEADAKAKRINGDQYALLYDRLALSRGNLQRYGTQLSTRNRNEMFVEKLEDPEHVDERRKELGMQPLADYISGFMNR